MKRAIKPIKIQKAYPFYGIDFVLVNGEILNTLDWNGELYELPNGTLYKPVYKGDEIVAFERWKKILWK